MKPNYLIQSRGLGTTSYASDFNSYLNNRGVTTSTTPTFSATSNNSTWLQRTERNVSAGTGIVKDLATTYLAIQQAVSKNPNQSSYDIDLGNGQTRTYTRQEMEQMVQAQQSNNASNEMLMQMMLSMGQNNQQKAEKDNTILYVGLGVGGLLLVGLLAMVMMNNKK